MDEGVDEAEDPDRSGHVTHTSPHAEHSTGVVVGLESGAELALGEDDEGIKDLVELGEVEDPAVEGKTLVPETARVEAAGVAIGTEGDVGRVGLESTGLIAVEDGVAETSGTVDAADGVDETSETFRTEGAHERAADGTEHADEGPGGVDGEEDIVGNDKPVERPGLADSPGLLAGRLVVDVEELGGNGVDGSDGQRDLGVQPGVVNIIGDVEDGRGVGADRRRGDEARVGGGRELEEGCLGQGEGDGRHCDSWCNLNRVEFGEGWC